MQDEFGTYQSQHVVRVLRVRMSSPWADKLVLAIFVLWICLAVIVVGHVEHGVCVLLSFV